MTMKVILDANIFLSYLLTPSTERIITNVVRACFSDEIDLLVPPELLEEIVDKLQNKKYFRERVPQHLIDDFVQQMAAMTALTISPETLTAFSRDPDDDYLIAYGLVNEVDYLVTADLYLLVLRQIENLKIVAPKPFLDVLKALRA